MGRMATTATASPDQRTLLYAVVAAVGGAGIGYLLAQQRGAACPQIGTAWPFLATVRGSSGSDYDRQWQGVPVLAQPAPDWGLNPTAVVRRIPFGASVRLTCGPVATPWTSDFPVALYWGVEGGGFVHNWDLRTSPDHH
jgi:hypothetical protein